MVELKGGLLVNLEALQFLLDLEARGIVCRVENGRIFPEPLSGLTEANVVALKRHRWQILGLLVYVAPEPTVRVLSGGEVFLVTRRNDGRREKYYRRESSATLSPNGCA